MARPFDCCGQLSLCLGRIARDTPGQNFAPLRHEFAQAGGVFIINIGDFFGGENANLFLSASPSFLMGHIICPPVGFYVCRIGRPMAAPTGD